MLKMRPGQRLYLLSALPMNRLADTCTGRPTCWQHRQPNKPLSDSPVKTTIESVRPVRSGQQTVQNIYVLVLFVR